MLRAALGFFVLAIIALVLGLSGIAGLSMQIAYFLVAAFIVLAIISGLVHILGGGGGRVTHQK